MMEWIPLLILTVFPHVSTIPLEEFYPFGEIAGDEYLTGIHQREGRAYLEILEFGNGTGNIVAVSMKFFCVDFAYREVTDVQQKLYFDILVSA